MDWKEAIASLRKLEGASESVNILEAEVNRLTNANFELVKDVRKETSKSKEAEGKLTDLLQLLGAEGEDLKAKAESANVKVKELQTEIDKATLEKTDLEAKYKTLSDEAIDLKRRNTIADAATKSGAIADVLATLVKDIPVERIEIEKDGVVILSEDGKQRTGLKEYAESQWAAFVPALFPSNTGHGSTSSRLPSGSPSPNPPKEENLLRAYRAGTYDKTIQKLANKT